MKRVTLRERQVAGSVTEAASCFIRWCTCMCSTARGNCTCKRPEWKDIQPGKWDTAVGGHVDLGESVDMALKREVREELGITDYEPTQLTHYVFESEREKELVFCFRTQYDGPVAPSDELDGGRFWPLEEIRENLGKGVFTPNFEQEFKRLGF